MKTTSIYVVLSQSRTLLSQAIRFFTGNMYTHAALSLDENIEYMFSFGRRWANNPFIGCFKHESIDDGMYPPHLCLPGAILKFSVTPGQYRSIVSMVWHFLLNAHKYGYNYHGLFGNIVGMRCESDTRFFCSEFVYHVLSQSGICDLRVRRSAIHPQDFMDFGGELIFEGDLRQYQSASGIMGPPDIFAAEGYLIH